MNTRAFASAANGSIPNPLAEFSLGSVVESGLAAPVRGKLHQPIHGYLRRSTRRNCAPPHRLKAVERLLHRLSKSP
jgi:hypothetical protein